LESSITMSHTMLIPQCIAAMSAKNTEIQKLLPTLEEAPVESLVPFSEFVALVVSDLPSGSSSLEELDLQARWMRITKSHLPQRLHSRQPPLPSSNSNQPWWWRHQLNQWWCNSNQWWCNSNQWWCNSQEWCQCSSQEWWCSSQEWCLCSSQEWCLCSQQVWCNQECNSKLSTNEWINR